MKELDFYKSADFFMARFANLPFGLYELSERSEGAVQLEALRRYPLAEEALRHASPSLARQLDKRLDRMAQLSLVKYWIRMCSRSTPFGLFSSVGWGAFGERTSISFDSDLLKKEISLSLECLFKLLHTTHSQKEIVNNLLVILNPQLVFKAGRAFFNPDSQLGESYRSVKITKAFEIIAQEAKKPILYGELEKRLSEKYPEDKRKDAQGYLWKLFEIRYLISELADAELFLNSPEKFFGKLSGTSEDFSFFQSISAAQNKKEALEKIESRYPEIKNPFRVDCFYEAKNLVLSNRVRLAAEKAASLLAYLNAQDRLPENLSQFHRYFLNEYGMERLIPFRDLMNCSIVQDLLSSDPLHVKIDPFQTLHAREYLNKGFDLAPIVDSNHEIAQESLPLSFDLFFELFADNPERIEQGEFQLFVKGMSHQAGAAFGRFLYHWKEDQIEKLRDILREEEALYPEILFVETSFLPDAHKAANVSLGARLRSLRLPMGYHDANEDDLDLNDLWVGAGPEKIYVFSKRWKKEVVFSSNVMTNPLYMPPPLRLLLLLSRFRFKSVSGFVPESLASSAYIPRLFYQNIIVSPAQWRFSFDSLGLRQTDSRKRVESVLEEFFLRYQVPKRVFYSQGDNQLLLNRTLKHHFEILTNEFIKNKTGTLLEEIKEIRKGAHATEFVLPLVRRASVPIQTQGYPAAEEVAPEERIFLPGSEWLYGKIFVPEHEANRFISKELLPFMNDLSGKTNLGSWFYIRYFEKAFQIRLRIKGGSNLLSSLSEWIAELMKRGEVEDLHLAPYKREIERYGGPECISYAEDFFSADSLCVSRLLSLDTDRPLPDVWMASLGIVLLMHRFFPDREAALEALFFEKRWLEGIRPYSKVGIDLAESLVFEEGVLCPRLAVCYSLIVPALDRFSRKTVELEREGKLWCQKSSIVNSLIHMHCNRFLGLSRELENKARAGAFHFLEKMHEKRNRRNIA